jgi:uncharacterized repeat protein (TIGR01451 family)
VLSGSDITYTITVTNLGSTPATNITVTDLLPASVSFVSCSANNGGICNGAGNNRSVDFASLAGGGSATVTLVATANCPLADGTVISNSASVAALTPDPNLNNNTSGAATTNVSNPPPVITGLNIDKPVLWPANHSLIDVAVDYNVTDNCGPVICRLTVVSNEPINGLGDGDTSPDWQILDSHRLKLRAERSGNGSGRIYTITTTCTDSANNVASKTGIVSVPKSMKGGATTSSVITRVINGESVGGAAALSPTRMLNLIGTINLNVESRATAVRSSKAENLIDLNLGTLKFNAPSYDQRELSGFRTLFRGAGKLNGEGGYRYLLNVSDGQAWQGGRADKFRLKIWNEKTGEVIFDNQLGDADDAEPTNAIGAGESISFPK